MASIEGIATVGTVARKFGAPVHQVEYVIRSRKIKPDGRAGNLRVFSAESVAVIGRELRKIRLHRDAKHQAVAR